MRRLFSPVFRMLSLCALAAVAVSAGLGAQDKPMTPSAAAPAPDAKLLERARALHKQVPLIDGHNDYPVGDAQRRRGTTLDKLDITPAAADAA